MANSNFVDYVKIYFTSGNGGRGAVSWRREKFVDHGGPDGGDGGAGASIYIRGNAQLWTLLDLKYRKFIKAPHGEAGQKRNRAGARGEDVVLDVPIGTVARDAETDELLGEITEEGQKLLLLPGGRGGLGNWHFRSSTNQTPDYAQPGESGQEKAVVLELKILADVGLVGLPNAGKSTLLSVVSAAKPEIADYPFTTLVPNLGIVRYKDYLSFVMADIPGIIEGAHEGKGLGTRFLRHIERNAVLLFLVPVSVALPALDEDPDTPVALDRIRDQYQLLLRELDLYDPELASKPRMLVLSQADLATPEQRAVLEAYCTDPGWRGLDVQLLSSLTRDGIDRLLDHLWALIQQANADDGDQPLKPGHYVTT